MTLLAIDNAPMPAPWGGQGGITALLGRGSTGAQEAELWLGAHPRSPSQVTESGAQWSDLLDWEESSGQRLPFLLKILDAAAPLSLQAHPNAQQAQRGYQREQEAGIPQDADDRNYVDPRPKPEMIVALASGFEALCGFRDPADVAGMLRRIRNGMDDAGLESQVLLRWERKLVSADYGSIVGWLLSETVETEGLLDELEAATALFPEELALVPRLLSGHPGDPGVAVALLLNHEVLAAGEALWLPAGTIHAYLRGTGIELMGPSDNVLRGGLTDKHVDVDELLAVLESAPGPATRVSPGPCDAGARSYRAAQGRGGEEADFELLEVTGDAAVRTTGPSLVAVLEGDFTVATQGRGAARRAGRGDFLLHPQAGQLNFAGRGRAFLATARR